MENSPEIRCGISDANQLKAISNRIKRYGIANSYTNYHKDENKTNHLGLQGVILAQWKLVYITYIYNIFNDSDI